MALNESGHIFAGTFDAGVFRTIDKGKNWVKINNGLPGEPVQSLLVNDNAYVFAGTLGEGIFRSADNGENWVETNNGIPNNFPSNKYIRALAKNENGLIFVGTDRGVFRSSNNGDNWTGISNGLPNSPVLTLAMNSSGDIFAGTQREGVFRSSNDGDTWMEAKNGLTHPFVRTLAINESGDLFAGTSGGGVFRSEDNGDNWIEINNNLGNRFVSSLLVNATGQLIAGTNGGVYGSADNGDNWIEINDGLTNKDVFSLAINDSGQVIAGTNGGVFLSQKLITVSVESKHLNPLKSYHLSQNYPNPFNPTTTIQFSLPIANHVTLKIYNTLGMEVAILADKSFTAGSYFRTWDASGLSSGIYFYRIEAGRFAETKKLLLVK